MYAKHCHFVVEEETVHEQKLEHLPQQGMYLKLTPLSTGVMTRYVINDVTLVMQEVTTNYPAPPGGSSVDWEHKWVIEIEEEAE